MLRLVKILRLVIRTMPVKGLVSRQSCILAFNSRTIQTICLSCKPTDSAEKKSERLNVCLTSVCPIINKE